MRGKAAGPWVDLDRDRRAPGRRPHNDHAAARGGTEGGVRLPR